MVFVLERDIRSLFGVSRSLSLFKKNSNMSETEKQAKVTLLPLSRIKTIMRSSPEVNNLSPDSIFLVAKAAELFVGYLAREALKVSDKKSTVDYSDLARVVNDKDFLEFLQDIVPLKIKASEYFEILKKVEEEEKKTVLEI